MKDVEIQLDSEMVVILNRKKRKFIIELRGNDFILRHAAIDFLEKKRMYDRRNTV